MPNNIASLYTSCGDLSARRADGTHDAQLPPALCDANQKRVNNDEQGHQKRERACHLQTLLRRQRRLLGEVAASRRSSNGDAFRQTARNGVRHRIDVRIWRRNDLNRVELARALFVTWAASNGITITPPCPVVAVFRDSNSPMTGRWNNGRLDFGDEIDWFPTCTPMFFASVVKQYARPFSSDHAPATSS